MKFLLIPFLFVLLFAGCSFVVVQDQPLDEKSINDSKERGDLLKENLDDIEVLEVSTNDNQTRDELSPPVTEMVTVNESGFLFEVPKFILEDSAEVVFVPPLPEKPKITYLVGMEDEINYLEEPPLREILIEYEDLVPEEKDFIINHLIDFYERGGIENQDDRDIFLYYAIIGSISYEAFGKLELEAAQIYESRS